MAANQRKKLRLFEGYGVEMEYMIVSRKDLRVLPIVDRLFERVAGEVVSDVDRGPIAWSNELVSHVVELKTNGPVAGMEALPALFHQNVLELNSLLADLDAMLLPTGAHPLMDPYTETEIWPHENNEIYALYNRIFDCRGHGWSNLQSTHINLPFDGDEEFARLHAAVRVLLPLIPALAASTPILDGKISGFVDTRLESYRHNQEKIPSIAGKVIPEQLFTHAEYDEQIFKRIRKDIAVFDKNAILDQHFLNSRGAIARFDRGAIEIRIIDIQECPAADVAILSFISEILKRLTAEEWCSFEVQKSWHEDPLAEIFLGTVQHGMSYQVKNAGYLSLLGLPTPELGMSDLWKHLAGKVYGKSLPEAIAHILKHGNLSERITRALGADPSTAEIRTVYRDLAECLNTNTMFRP